MSTVRTVGALDIDPAIAAIVFDLDGVVYRGTRLLDGAAALASRLRAAGVPFGFLTNGSTLDRSGVRHRFRTLGLDVGDAPVVTAIDAVAHHLGERFPNGGVALTIGADPLRKALYGGGRFRPPGSDDPPNAVDAVVVGLDTDFTYWAGAAAAAAIRSGAAFIATNGDRVRPTEGGLQPETGAISAFLVAATGVAPTIVGKPSAIAFELIARALGVPARALLMVGDNPDTDVRGAIGVGARAVLVLTGVATREAGRAADPAPTITVPDLRSLDRALPMLGVHLEPLGSNGQPRRG